MGIVKRHGVSVVVMFDTLVTEIKIYSLLRFV